MRETRLDKGWELIETRWADHPTVATHGWIPVGEPSHVHLHLMDHGLIADPLRGMGELGCQWVDESDWSYRLRFDARLSPEAPFRTLVFEGLDTVCTVILNGRTIAHHDNMFLPLEVDVAGDLVEGENELRIDFQSAAQVGRERRAAWFERHGIAGEIAGFEERSFVRKVQYMFGWDWGPRLVSCGVWQPVRLIEAREPWRRPETQAATPRARLRRTSDRWGESFEFEVDGRPLWAAGANWIPDASFPVAGFDDRYGRPPMAQRLRAAKAMGVNMLRVWGGGLYESDEFYELCEELDILVWQDFAFACAYYPDDEDWQARVRAEAEFQVRRLRRFSCLALWCGNNENLMMYEQKWGDPRRQPDRYYGQILFEEVLPDVIRRLDPERAYIPTSPWGGQPCNRGDIGDQHYWEVWHGKGDWRHYEESEARFASEFGFPSSNSARGWEAAGIADSLSLEARWHNKTGKPFSEFQRLVELHYSPARNGDDWNYFSQLNQRDAMRHALEHFRFSDFCRGALIWQLNDCWVSESWSLLEFNGDPKAAGLECARLFAPLLLRMRPGAGGVELQACLHNADRPQTGTARLRAFSLVSGETLAESEATIEVRPEEIATVLTLDCSHSTGDLIWLAEFAGARAWRLGVEPKDAKVTSCALRAQASPGGWRLSADRPVVDLRIESGEPAWLTLFPGDSIEVRASREAIEANRSLAGRHPVVFA